MEEIRQSPPLRRSYNSLYKLSPIFWWQTRRQHWRWCKSYELCSDVHKNLTCDNSNCHMAIGSHSNAIIGSCYNTNCHKPSGTAATDRISQTRPLWAAAQCRLRTVNIPNSRYRLQWDIPHSRFTVPCIICHGPCTILQNPTIHCGLLMIQYEDSQCKTCHSSNTEHNSSNTTSGGVNCTLCHSDDVHVIQVFAQNGTTWRVKRIRQRNCTNCHQNSTFITILQSSQSRKLYGRISSVQSPMKHSDDPISGTKWNQTPATGQIRARLHGACTATATHLIPPPLWWPSNFKE